MRDQKLKGSQNNHNYIYDSKNSTDSYFWGAGVSVIYYRLQYEVNIWLDAKTAAKSKTRAYPSKVHRKLLKDVKNMKNSRVVGKR